MALESVAVADNSSISVNSRSLPEQMEFNSEYSNYRTSG